MTPDEHCPPRELNYARGKISKLAQFFQGQIMTVDDMNELVDALKELDERVRMLEDKCK